MLRTTLIVLLLLLPLPCVGQEWVRTSGPLPEISVAGVAGEYIVLWGDSGAVVIDTAGTLVADSIPTLTIGVEAFAWCNDTLWAGGHGGLQYSVDKGLSWESTEIESYTLPLWTPGERLIVGLREGDTLVPYDPIRRIRWGYAITVIPQITVLPGDTLVVLVDSTVLLCGPNSDELHDGRDRISQMQWIDNATSGWVGIRNDTVFHSSDSFRWDALFPLPEPPSGLSCVGDRVIVWSRTASTILPSGIGVTATIFDLDDDDPASTMRRATIDHPSQRCTTPDLMVSTGSLLNRPTYRFVTLLDLVGGRSRYIGPAIPDETGSLQVVDRDSVQLLVGDRIWRSTNRGQTWLTTLPSIVPEWGPHRACRTSIHGNTLAHVQHTNAPRHSALWVSTDLGCSWADHGDTVTALATASDAVGLYALTSEAIMRSLDEGQTWHQWVAPLTHTPSLGSSEWFDVEGGLIVYSVTEGRAVASTDSGQTWHEFSRGREWGAVPIVDGHLIRASAERSESEISTDGGVTWIAGEQVPEPYRYWERISLVGGVPTRFQPGAAPTTWIIEQFHRSSDRWVVIDSVSAVASMETYHLQLTEYRRLFQIAQLTSDPPAPSRSLYVRSINGPLITHVHTEAEPPAECLAVRADGDGWWVQASTSQLGDEDLRIYNLSGGVVTHAARSNDGSYYVPRSGLPHQPLWAVVGGCAVRLQ